MNDKQMAIMKEALTEEEFEKFSSNVGGTYHGDDPAEILCSAFDWDRIDTDGVHRYWSKIHDRLDGL